MRGSTWRGLIVLTLIGLLGGSLSLSRAPVPLVAAAGALQVPAAGQSPTIDAIKQAGKLRAGVAIAVPWLGQDPSSGKYFGPAIDVSERIAQLLGVKVEYVPLGWDVIIAGLQGKQIDLAMAPLFATDKRKQVVDFVNYTLGGTCYAVRKDNKKIQDADSMNNPSVVIGTFTGTGTEQEIKKKYPQATINSVVQAPGNLTRILEVLAKRIDVAPMDNPLAIVVQAKYPDVRIIPKSADYCVTHPDIPVPIGMAFNKGDPALSKFLEDVVKSMQKQIDAEILKYSSPKYLTI